MGSIYYCLTLLQRWFISIVIEELLWITTYYSFRRYYKSIPNPPIHAPGGWEANVLYLPIAINGFHSCQWGLGIYRSRRVAQSISQFQPYRFVWHCRYLQPIITELFKIPYIWGGSLWIKIIWIRDIDGNNIVFNKNILVWPKYICSKQMCLI